MSLRSLLDALTSGSMMALICTGLGGIGLLGYSFAVSQQTVYLPYALAVLAIISVLIGGMQGGLVSGAIGWVHGGAVGGFYLLMLLLVKGFLSSSLGYDPNGIMFAVAVLIFGAIGGIIGVNMRFFRRRRIKRRYMGY